MLPDQMVEMTWNSNNKKYFLDKGYSYTQMLDVFMVDVKDLRNSYKEEIFVVCDNCEQTYKKIYRNYKRLNDTHGKDYCPDCESLRYSLNISNKIKFKNKVEIYKDLLTNRIKLVPTGFWKSLTNSDITEIFHIFVDCLLKDNIIENINDIPRLDSTPLYKEYKLISLFKYYNTQDVLEIAYPNRWKSWEFNRVIEGFWNKENNLKDACDWLILKLFEDKIITSLDNILDLDGTIFNKYHLEGLLTAKFNCSPINFWQYFFPNKWYVWEFKSVHKGFWEDKENRINSIKELCTKLNIKIDELPLIINYPFIVNQYHRFSWVCDKYYKSDMFLWVDECFPNMFKPEDFNYIIGSNGVRLDSKEEKIIHEYFLCNFNVVKYYENNICEENKWFNEVENENYVADWLLNDKLIIEYFGWYHINSYNKDKRITEYIDKADRKITFFNSLSDYNFIALYPKDLRNNLKGVKDKLSKVLLELEV